MASQGLSRVHDMFAMLVPNCQLSSGRPGKDVRYAGTLLAILQLSSLLLGRDRHIGSVAPT
jgi:hypothetical protein